MSVEVGELAGHLIRRLNQIAVSTFQDQMKKNGFELTPVQFAALNSIDANPEIDQAGLAKSIGYDRATIGGVIERLVARGIIERKVCVHDRRARELTLTKLGNQILKEATPVVLKLQSSILSGLDDNETEMFLALARKSISHVSDT